MRTLLRILLMTAVTALGADISGTWNFAVETDAGGGNPVFSFKQDGEKLTGTYSGLFGKADVEGTVRGNQVEFSFRAEAGGQKVKIVYKGAVETASRMKGTVEFGELGKGTWTAEKK
jgi:hypothetical protein